MDFSRRGNKAAYNLPAGGHQQHHAPPHSPTRGQQHLPHNSSNKTGLAGSYRSLPLIASPTTGAGGGRVDERQVAVAAGGAGAATTSVAEKTSSTPSATTGPGGSFAAPISALDYSVASLARRGHGASPAALQQHPSSASASAKHSYPSNPLASPTRQGSVTASASCSSAASVHQHQQHPTNQHQIEAGTTGRGGQQQQQQLLSTTSPGARGGQYASSASSSSRRPHKNYRSSPAVAGSSSPAVAGSQKTPQQQVPPTAVATSSSSSPSKQRDFVRLSFDDAEDKDRLLRMLAPEQATRRGGRDDEDSSEASTSEVPAVAGSSPAAKGGKMKMTGMCPAVDGAGHCPSGPHVAGGASGTGPKVANSSSRTSLSPSKSLLRSNTHLQHDEVDFPDMLVRRNKTASSTTLRHCAAGSIGTSSSTMNADAPTSHTAATATASGKSSSRGPTPNRLRPSPGIKEPPSLQTRGSHGTTSAKSGPGPQHQPVPDPSFVVSPTSGRLRSEHSAYVSNVRPQTANAEMQSRWRLRRHNRRERVAQLTGAGTTAAVGGRCSPGQLRDPPADWEDELWDLFFYGVPHHQRPEPGVLPPAWPSAQCVAGGGCSLSPVLADQHPAPGLEESATPSGGPVAAVSPARRLFSLPSQSPPKTPTMTSSSSSPLAFYPERGGGPHQQSSPLFGGGTTSSLFSAGILSGMGNQPAEGLWVPPKFRESDHIVSRIAEKVELPLQENAECAKIVWCQDRDDLERFLQQARVSHARQARADKEQVEHRNLVRDRLVNAVGAARAAHLLHQLGAGGGGAAAVFAGGGGGPDHAGPTGGSIASSLNANNHACGTPTRMLKAGSSAVGSAGGAPPSSSASTTTSAAAPAGGAMATPTSASSVAGGGSMMRRSSSRSSSPTKQLLPEMRNNGKANVGDVAGRTASSAEAASSGATDHSTSAATRIPDSATATSSSDIKANRLPDENENSVSSAGSSSPDDSVGPRELSPERLQLLRAKLGLSRKINTEGTPAGHDVGQDRRTLGGGGRSASTSYSEQHVEEVVDHEHKEHRTSMRGRPVKPQILVEAQHNLEAASSTAVTTPSSASEHLASSRPESTTNAGKNDSIPFLSSTRTRSAAGGSYPPQSASFLFDREPGDVVYVNRFPQMFHITRKDLLARNLQSLHKHLPDDYNFYPPTYCLSTDRRQLQKYLSFRFSSGVSLLPPGGMFGENGDGTGNATNEENGNENPLGQLQCQGLWFTGLLGGRHSQERARLRLVRKDPSSPLLQAIQAPLTPLNEPPQFLASPPSPGVRRNSTGGLNFPGEATTQTLAQAIGGGRETAGGSSPSKWRPDRINARTPEAKSKASRSRRNSTGGGDDGDNGEDEDADKGSSDEDERVESEKDGSGNERERGKRCTFILKPADGSKGNGIRLCQITQDAYRKGTWADDLTKHIQHILGSADATRNLQNERRFLLQRYVTAPSTLECDIKWDARVYVVITSTRPQLQAYLFDEGFARLCTLPYQRPRPHNLQDFGRHLTNFSINWREDNFDDTGEPHTGSKRSLKCVLAQISRLYGMSGTAELWLPIADVVAKTLLAVAPKLDVANRRFFPKNVRPFQLLGFDVMFHNDLSKCWLLEVNHDPSLSVLTYVDRVVKGKLVAQIFELIGAVGPDPEAVKDRGRGGGAGGATEVDTVTESDRDETESEERGGRRCRPGTTWVPALLSDASEAEYAQRRELDKKKRKRSNLMKGVAAGGKVTGGEDSDTDWSECGDATSDGHSCNKRRGRRGHSHRGLLTENFLNFHVTANFMHLLPITPEMHGEACCEKAREITAVATKNASKWLEFSAEHLYDHNHEGVVQPAAGT